MCRGIVHKALNEAVGRTQAIVIMESIEKHYTAEYQRISQVRNRRAKQSKYSQAAVRSNAVKQGRTGFTSAAVATLSNLKFKRARLGETEGSGIRTGMGTSRGGGSPPPGRGGGTV